MPQPAAKSFQRASQAVSGLLPWILALGCALAAVLPALAVHGLWATRAAGDSPFLLQRTFEMAAALGDGHFPVRWMPDAAYGLGYPFWNYYAPLAYLVSGLLALLGAGIIGGIKVTVLLAFLAAAAGAYRLAERTWRSRPAALVAAAAYTFAPFHLVNLYVRGDALSELVAYACFPWLLVAVDRAISRPTVGSVVRLAVVTTALLLSHNISALLFLPLGMAYVIWRCVWPAAALSRPRLTTGVPLGVPPARAVALGRWSWSGPVLAARVLLALERRLWRLRPSRRTRGWLAVFGGGLLGLMLAAWFWLPALGQGGAVQLRENLTGYFDYHGHFRALSQLVQWQPVFDYAPGEGCAPCRMGLVQLALAAIATAVGLWRRRRVARDERRSWLFWIGAALATTFMITPQSANVWSAVPLVAFAQFPWRWLGVQALAMAMLSAGAWAMPARLGLGAVRGGAAVENPDLPPGSRPGAVPAETARGADWSQANAAGSFLHNPRRLPWVAWTLALAATALLAAAALLRLPVETLSVRDVTREDLAAYELFSGNIGSTVRAEYLPQAVKPRPMSSVDLVEGHAGAPRAVPGFGTVVSAVPIRQTAHRQDWQLSVAGDTKTTVAFPTLWFPGWSAAINGGPEQPTGVLEGSGWLTVDIDAGLCPAPRHCAVTLILGRDGLRALAEGLSLAALLCLAALLMLDRRRRWDHVFIATVVLVAAVVLLARALPVGEAAGPVTLDFGRTPYPHANPKGIWYGDGQLKNAEVTQRDAAFELKFETLHMPASWRAEVALVSPAEPIFDVPDVRAKEDWLLSDPKLFAIFTPTDLATGWYFLRLRVLEGDRVIPARSAEGYRLGTVYLGPYHFNGAGFIGDASHGPLADMGDVTLQDVTTAVAGRQLEVRMVWKTDRPLALDYQTSVRLAGPDGKVVEDDKEPLYGFYPTTAWTPNVLVVDRRWLTLPEGLQSGSNYTVEVVLYDGLTNKALGSGLLKGVAIP